MLGGFLAEFFPESGRNAGGNVDSSRLAGENDELGG